MAFPMHRPRRLRRTEPLRRLVRETRLAVDQLVYPLFVVPGQGVRTPISSMPGCFHLSVDRAVEECRAVAGLGIPGVLLFGLPEQKDAEGTGAYAADGIVQRAVAAIKQAVPDLMVMADTCLCEYTSHGHCGVLAVGDATGHVQNDLTLDLLARTAVSQAAAGADVVAPSDMMDGRVGAIRQALDEHGFEDVAILSYAAKYASAFYGPFREAADSAPQVGDRRTYQLDPPNVREALREMALDLAEGADMLMV
ncbi:MAG: porphobilinogen synthase, partial [Dehalococcoidia bacterium]|nr:porphobilinogen synthase [Dehalococcoidia bacterium]